MAIAVSPSAAAAAPTAFVAHLSGANEVPPNPDSQGTGTAVFTPNADGTQLSYVLTATNLTTPVVAAHIHAPAPAGQNTGVVAFLFPPNPNSTCVLPSPTTVQCWGAIGASDLRGPFAGQPLSALLAVMAAGQSYTNVHTTRHPGGEIRGQNIPL
jgi:hypothetical protein